MSNRSLGIPFTRMFERVQSQMREMSTESEIEDKYKRVVNQSYQQDVTSYFEWDYLRRESFISLIAEHTTGNVDVAAGGTSVTGGTTSPAFTSAMTGRKFKFDANDEIYTFTFVSATSGTISPAFTGTAAITDGTYKIFQDTYDLPTDYGDMTTEPGAYYDVSGGRQPIYWLGEEDWSLRYTTTGAEYATYWRESPTRTSLGDYQIQINPHPTVGRLLRVEYLKLVDELREFTTGTATTTANSTTATTSSDFSANISAGQFFRIDGQNEWRRISAVSGTTVTLENAYTTTNSGAAYTVCDGLDMPRSFEDVVFYGACLMIALEQGENASNYASLYQEELDKRMKKRNRKRFGRRAMKRFSRSRRYR